MSFTEAIDEVPAGRRTTGRLRRAIGAAVGDAARSVAEVADAHGVSWPTAHTAFIEHADALLTAPEPTTVLGIDETRRGKPRWVQDSDTERWRRVDPYDTGFVDLDGDQGLLGQREGRTSKSVVDWLEQQSVEFREAVLFVAIDPAAVYAKAIRTPGLLPNARLVVDHFHMTKLANDAVTRVRRRVIWEQQGRRGRKIDPAWANRRRLLTGQERLSARGFARMWNSLVDADPSGQVLAAWIAKEELRKLLALARTDAAPDQITVVEHIELGSQGPPAPRRLGVQRRPHRRAHRAHRDQSGVARSLARPRRSGASSPPGLTRQPLIGGPLLVATTAGA